MALVAPVAVAGVLASSGGFPVSSGLSFFSAGSGLASYSAYFNRIRSNNSIACLFNSWLRFHMSFLNARKFSTATI